MLDEPRFFAGHGGDITEQRDALLAATGPGFDPAAGHARRTAYREHRHAALGLTRRSRLGLRLAVASSSGRHPCVDRSRSGRAAPVLPSACATSLAGVLSRC